MTDDISAFARKECDLLVGKFVNDLSPSEKMLFNAARKSKVLTMTYVKDGLFAAHSRVRHWQPQDDLEPDEFCEQPTLE